MHQIRVLIFWTKNDQKGRFFGHFSVFFCILDIFFNYVALNSELEDSGFDDFQISGFWAIWPDLGLTNKNQQNRAVFERFGYQIDPKVTLFR